MTRLRGDFRLLVAAALIVVVVAAILVAPYPSVQQIRDWAAATGPLLPLIFLTVHAVATIFPIPRTIFTLSAGLLFGPWLGIGLSVIATTLSAIAALWLVRAIGRDAVWQRITSPAVRQVDERIHRRGWLAVGSLRLIGFIPFSVVNYTCGVTSIRTTPYTLATMVGILPGTIGIVVLADALSGNTNPGLLALSAVCIAIGLAGLLIDAKRPPLTDEVNEPGVSRPGASTASIDTASASTASVDTASVEDDAVT